MNCHHSVHYCPVCDWYVAAIETTSCCECLDRIICPGCAKPTRDASLQACSHFCAARFNRRIREQDTQPKEAA